MAELERYYNDENWNEFSSLFDENLNPIYIKLLAGNLDNDIIVAKVIFGIFNNQSLNWINQKIPALDNLTAKDCVANSILKNRLKECLMRMPI